MSSRRWLRWLVWIGGAITALVVVGVVAFVAVTRNPDIPDFYTPPDEVTAEPGTILRSEPFADGVPDGAQAWRVLYTSTDEDDRPIAISGLVIAPTEPEPGPQPVLAWAHGTTGIDRACAPSLTDAPLEGIPDMTGALARGWVVALTDYPGLGTPGPHPYLVGESQGRAVLDSVRAAHALDTGVDLDDRYTIWGHSQGGHAALFAGELAPTYLPELELVSVAALSPGTRVGDNLAAIEGTVTGNVLTILTVGSWQEYFSDIPDGTLTEAGQRAAERVIRNCINQPSRLRLLIAGLTLPDELVAIDPTTDPVWTRHLEDNTPDPEGIEVPLFVGQGLADEIIDADVTSAWVSDRCSTGASTRFRTYPDVTHNGVVDPGGADALAFTIDRFEGVPVADACVFD